MCQLYHTQLYHVLCELEEMLSVRLGVGDLSLYTAGEALELLGVSLAPLRCHISMPRLTISSAVSVSICRHKTKNRFLIHQLEQVMSCPFPKSPDKLILNSHNTRCTEKIFFMFIVNDSENWRLKIINVFWLLGNSIKTST